MQVSPMKKRRVPGYPTRLEVLATPGLLERCIPESWLKKRWVAGSMSVLMVAAGCSEQSSSVTEVDPDVPDQAIAVAEDEVMDRTIAATEIEVIDQTVPLPDEALSDHVAPIFKHGEGRGSWGCVVVNPPAFLSEEEAMEVISDELGKVGIDLTEQDVLIRTLHYNKSEYDREKRAMIETPAQEEYRADAIDRQKHVAVEFWTSRDDLHFRPPMESAGSHNFSEALKDIPKQLKPSDEDLYVATFYDPMTTPLFPQPTKEPGDPDQAAVEPPTSKEHLRAQVKDFVDWLQGQGVI